MTIAIHARHKIVLSVKRYEKGHVMSANLKELLKQLGNEKATELAKKAAVATSAENLTEIAKAEGVELTLEQAQAIFEKVGGDVELSVDDLDAASGGMCPWQSEDDCCTHHTW